MERMMNIYWEKNLRPKIVEELTAGGIVLSHQTGSYYFFNLSPK